MSNNDSRESPCQPTRSSKHRRRRWRPGFARLTPWLSLVGVAACVALEEPDRFTCKSDRDCHDEEACLSNVCVECKNIDCSTTTCITCQGRCVDILTDPLNCSGCGIQCASGRSCRGGACRISTSMSVPGAGGAPNSNPGSSGGSGGAVSAGGGMVAAGGTAGGAPSCADGLQNGAETDVDCGGFCPTRCGVGEHCVVDGDCVLPASGHCAAGTCTEASCSDVVRNGTETDVDCGGDCRSCDLRAKCTANEDCSSRACYRETCVTCLPGATRCVTGFIQTCLDSLVWGGYVACNLPHSRASCLDGGVCVVEACAEGYGNCDGSDVNGCETYLNDPEGCGTTCDNRVVCSVTHGSANCNAGTCGIASCERGTTRDENGCSLSVYGCVPGPRLTEVAGPEGSTTTRYCMDSTEVTRDQYRFFLESDPPTTGQDPSCSWNTDYTPTVDWPPETGLQIPVTGIDWCDAFAYCEWAGKRLCGALGGGANEYTDHAEANQSEWMNACSEGGASIYPYGDTYGAETCNGVDNGLGRATPVGQNAACEGGYPDLQDLSGNIAEWENSCSDQAGPSDLCRVRGGSWRSGASMLRCDHDFTANRDTLSDAIGFRCCAP